MLSSLLQGLAAGKHSGCIHQVAPIRLHPWAVRHLCCAGLPHPRCRICACLIDLLFEAVEVSLWRVSFLQRICLLSQYGVICAFCNVWVVHHSLVYEYIPWQKGVGAVVWVGRQRPIGSDGICIRSYFVCLVLKFHEKREKTPLQWGISSRRDTLFSSLT